MVILLKNISSEHLPPNMQQILSYNSSRVSRLLSFGRYYAYPNDPFDLGIMVSFNNGAPPSKNQLTTACPDS